MKSSDCWVLIFRIVSRFDSKVQITVQIVNSAAGLMIEDAKFWVVEPRVTLSGVWGLGTLLSGNYIGFEAGTWDKKQRNFIGLETPPIITGGQPGRQFVLKADDLSSLGVGSPVYYPRLQVGQLGERHELWLPRFPREKIIEIDSTLEYPAQASNTGSRPR